MTRAGSEDFTEKEATMGKRTRTILMICLSAFVACIATSVQAQSEREKRQEEEGFSQTSKTYRRGNTTVVINTDEEGHLTSAHVTIATYNIRGQLVWMELYIYKPLEGETIQGDEVALLAERLLTQPVMEEADFRLLELKVELFRHQILWEQIAGDEPIAPRLETPVERSPDGT